MGFFLINVLRTYCTSYGLMIKNIFVLIKGCKVGDVSKKRYITSKLECISRKEVLMAGLEKQFKRAYHHRSFRLPGLARPSL